MRSPRPSGGTSRSAPRVPDTGIAQPQHGRAGGAQVADREVDAAGGADVHAAGWTARPTSSSRRAAPTRSAAADEQRRRHDPEGEQLDEPEHAAGQRAGRRRRGRRASPAGSARCAYRALPAGTGTARSTSVRASAADDALELRLRGDEQPVGEHRLGQRLEVVGDHVAAAARRPPGPGPPAAGRAWRGATCRARGAGGGARRWPGRRGTTSAPAPRAPPWPRRPCPARRRSVITAPMSSRASWSPWVSRISQLALGGRVAHRDAHEEPVELRLGQRVGALVLDRVLGGDHHERAGQLVGRAVDRDLRLGHRLEQRRLRLRGGPVDLVGQHDVAEHRPGRNSNSLVLRFHTVRPTTSVGSRSGVNCSRPKVPSIDAASALARLVLPTPGTSSMRRWPSDTRHRSTSSITSGLPWMTRSMLSSDGAVVVGEGVSDGGLTGGQRVLLEVVARPGQGRPRPPSSDAAARRVGSARRGQRARCRRRRHEAGGRRRRPRTATLLAPSARAPHRRCADGEAVLAALLGAVAEVRTGDEVACGVGSGGPMTRGGEPVSPLNIPGWRGLPAARAAGGGARPRRCTSTTTPRPSRSARGGAARPGASATTSPWSCPPASAAASCSTAACSTATTATPATSATSSSSPTAARARAARQGCLEAEASAARPSRRAPARRRRRRPREERQRAGRLVGRAVGVGRRRCSTCGSRVVAGSVALGLRRRLLRRRPGRSSTDRARIEFARGARDPSRPASATTAR